MKFFNTFQEVHVDNGRSVRVCGCGLHVYGLRLQYPYPRAVAVDTHSDADKEATFAQQPYAVIKYIHVIYNSK